jgi:hypothetical protein
LCETGSGAIEISRVARDGVSSRLVPGKEDFHMASAGNA